MVSGQRFFLREELWEPVIHRGPFYLSPVFSGDCFCIPVDFSDHCPSFPRFFSFSGSRRQSSGNLSVRWPHHQHSRPPIYTIAMMTTSSKLRCSLTRPSFARQTAFEPNCSGVWQRIQPYFQPPFPVPGSLKWGTQCPISFRPSFARHYFPHFVLITFLVSVFIYHGFCWFFPSLRWTVLHCCSALFWQASRHLFVRAHLQPLSPIAEDHQVIHVHSQLKTPPHAAPRRAWHIKSMHMTCLRQTTFIGLTTFVTRLIHMTYMLKLEGEC